MPSIDVAMARSVRGGVGGILARSLQAVFEETRTVEVESEKRNVVSTATTGISSVKDSFSSWNNCMAAVYCKWPVIAVIIIGALSIISIVWCISRCLCCGLSCCCECCHCLKCCGDCCGCCDPPGNGRHRKHLDEPSSYNNISNSTGYKREDPMAASSALPFDRPRPTAASPPQYASFDVSKQADADDKADALPAMPVWGDAESKKIHLAEEAVELRQLKPPGAVDASVPLMTAMSPAGTPTPGGASPYSVPGSQAASSGYLGPGSARGASPYGRGQPGQPGQGYGGGMHNNAYGQSNTSFHTDQSWGAMSGPGARPMGQQGERGRPQQQQQRQQQPGGYGHAGAYSQEPEGYGEQPAYDNYHPNNMPPAAGLNQPPRYGTPPGRSMTGGSTASSMRGGPGPGPGPGPGYNTNQERVFDPRITPQRTQSPAPAQGAYDQRAGMPQQRPSPPQQYGAAFGGGGAGGPMRASPPQQQGGFDPRGMPPQQRGSPAPPQQQQVAFGQMPPPQRTASPAQRCGSPGPRAYSPAPQQQQQQQAAFGQMPPPQRTASPAQRYGSPGPRAYSPAPQQQQQGPPRYGGGPGQQQRGPPQRQMSADQQYQQRGGGGGGGGLPPRAPPYRQDSAAAARQGYGNSSSPRPGGGGGWGQQQQQRGMAMPSRSQTVDQMEPPSSPGPRDNFSRPTRSNTYDHQQQQQQQQQQGGGSAYPGYKPYQPGR